MIRVASAIRREPVPLDVPDIVWTLPEKAVRLVATKFPGWSEATAELRTQSGAIIPKQVLRDHFDLNVMLAFLDRVLAVAREHRLEPSPALKGAVARVLT